MNRIGPWQDTVNVEFPRPGRITRETIVTTERESARFRGSVRISTGKIYTDAEYEQRRRQTRLP